MSDALIAKLRTLSDPRACRDNEFGVSVACAEAQACIEKLTAEITALRAEVDRLHTQRGDDAQQLIDFAATLAIAEEDASWDALRAHVAALEAVVLAARRAKRAWITMETAHDFAEPALAADALDAALAALEVPRG